MVGFTSRDKQNTEAVESATNGGPIERAFENAFEQIKNDKKQQIKIAQALKDNYGIEPQLLQLFFPDLQTDIPQENQEESELIMPEELESGPDGQEPTQEPVSLADNLTPQDLSDFVGELMEYLDEDTTLKELKEMIDNNPDVIQMALEQREI